jgi:dipeptidase E
VPFQLNPHYTDQNPPGHNGETRAQRLAEFMVLNKEMPIVAIVEGTALMVENNTVRLIGGENGFVFKGGNKSAITTECDLDHLL